MRACVSLSPAKKSPKGNVDKEAEMKAHVHRIAAALGTLAALFYAAGGSFNWR